MTTAVEDAVKQLKRSSRSKAILVPRIEQFMRKPIEIEDQEDRDFLHDLILARARPRKKGVYSPSMLANCVRQVYFTKTGVKKQPSYRLEASGFFLDGNFRHFKWQFALWKMHRAGIITLLDVGSDCIGTEIYVCNEKGDYGGTIDNILLVPELDLYCAVDWKGMNGNSFARSITYGPGKGYVTQGVGYVQLANSSLARLPKRITNLLIIGENKNGPVNNRRVKSPLGLYEWSVPIDAHKFDVSQRIKKLRAYERREEVPPPECTSTRKMMFKDCAFAPICRGEVEKIEKKKFKARKKMDKVKFDKKRMNGRK